MKAIKVRFNCYLFEVILFLLMFQLFSQTALSYDFSNWDHGADGYPYALSEARNLEKPLVLYFHMDNCEWSKKMNETYLAAGIVWRFLYDVPSVEVNPDRGPDEEALCKQYGVKDYPAFLVLFPAFDKRSRRIHPFGPKGDMSVNDFMRTLKEWIVNQYHKKAHAVYREKDFEGTLKYYEMALEYDPKSVYTYYAMGVTYHSILTREKDLDLVKDAEECYLKALKLDPNHKECKDGLERLRRFKKAHGID